jgi:hypothetical protein
VKASDILFRVCQLIDIVYCTIAVIGGTIISIPLLIILSPFILSELTYNWYVDERQRRLENYNKSASKGNFNEI